MAKMQAVGSKLFNRQLCVSSTGLNDSVVIGISISCIILIGCRLASRWDPAHGHVYQLKDPKIGE